MVVDYVAVSLLIAITASARSCGNDDMCVSVIVDFSKNDCCEQLKDTAPSAMS